MNSKLLPHKNDTDKYLYENIILIHNVGQKSRSNVRNFGERNRQQGTRWSHNVVDDSVFLFQKDYCSTREGKKTLKGIGWFLYKEQLSCLGFFWMEEEKLWGETTDIYKTIGSQDNSGCKRPQEISKSNVLLKAGSLMKSDQDTNKVMDDWSEWASCRCYLLPPV